MPSSLTCDDWVQLVSVLSKYQRKFNDYIISFSFYVGLQCRSCSYGLLFVSNKRLKLFVDLWQEDVLITVQENTELKQFEQLPWVQPMLHAGWNMFDQHLHCIVYTSRLISWATMTLTVYEPKVTSQQREQTFSNCFSVR